MHPAYKEFLEYKRHISRERKRCRENMDKNIRRSHWMDEYDKFNNIYQSIQGWMESRGINNAERKG